jgi:hypothetical protein
MAARGELCDGTKVVWLDVGRTAGPKAGGEGGQAPA